MHPYILGIESYRPVLKEQDFTGCGVKLVLIGSPVEGAPDG